MAAMTVCREDDVCKRSATESRAGHGSFSVRRASSARSARGHVLVEADHFGDAPTADGALEAPCRGRNRRTAAAQADVPAMQNRDLSRLGQANDTVSSIRIAGRRPFDRGGPLPRVRQSAIQRIQVPDDAPAPHPLLHELHTLAVLGRFEHGALHRDGGLVYGVRAEVKDDLLIPILSIEALQRRSQPLAAQQEPYRLLLPNLEPRLGDLHGRRLVQGLRRSGARCSEKQRRLPSRSSHHKETQKGPLVVALKRDLASVDSDKALDQGGRLQVVLLCRAWRHLRLRSTLRLLWLLVPMYAGRPRLSNIGRRIGRRSVAAHLKTPRPTYAHSPRHGRPTLIRCDPRPA
mmetsp:Transcript_113831/g.317934  ORF Transcript_113831/g.317934 Transcript_113831/m.317934 type:complete len:347 (+) Transcript_113831:117-1157(+)